ncbi:MAG: hypothetical protein WBP29_07685 [Candidatus Zixiibacteriota bacterium]
MRRQVPLFIIICVGWVLLFSVFIPPMESWGEDASLFFDIIAVFAFFLGGGNLIRVHSQKVSRKSANWGYSAVTLIGFLTMLYVGLFKIGNPSGIGGALDETGSWFQLMFTFVMSPLQSTMYSLLAFFVASASYRAFRAKNVEATILLLAAFVILLGRTPLGMALTAWIPESFSVFQIPNMAIWIMNAPNLAGQRAIMIGIALGVISMSLRLLLGIERSYLGQEK